MPVDVAQLNYKAALALRDQGQIRLQSKLAISGHLTKMVDSPTPSNFRVLPNVLGH